MRKRAYIGLLVCGLILLSCNDRKNSGQEAEKEVVAVLKSDSDAEKMLPVAKRKNLAMQNNPGQQANDFSYTMEDGGKQQLYALGARHTLLFFYNPECEACKEYTGLLAGSKVINVQIKKGLVKVLAVYVDKDISIWKKHLPEMPGSWIQGRDEDEYLYKNKVYDLHAIPTIYLLDRDKKVILKDVLDVKLVEAALD